jgi:TRAP-type uncharacterized transport system substrate-binding protein
MIVGDYAYKFWRYLAVAGTGAIFFGASLFIVTTLPPRELVMATGVEGDANYQLGILYREILAKEGVKLELQRTSGSLENLRLLRDPRSQVSVGFIQGGTTTSKEAPELESLGTVFYEPFWLFRRGENWRRRTGVAGPTTFDRFRGKRWARLGTANNRKDQT